MTFLYILIYFYLIFSLGLVVLGRRSSSSFIVASSSFLCGSLILGYLFWAFSLVQILDIKLVYFILFLLLIPGSLVFYKSLAWMKDKWKIDSPKISWEFWIILALIFVYFLDASTPPRSADAMRYHLAQLKDIWNHHGYIIRPYIHFQFPLFFSYLFLPIYALKGGGAIKLTIFCFLLIFLYLLQRLSYQLKLKRPLLAVCLFLSIPIIQLEGTTVTNDLVMMVFIFWGILLLNEKTDRKYEVEILAFLSLGMALWTKYQAVLYVPWYIYIFVKKNEFNQRNLIRLFGLLCLSFLVFSPHMVEHIYHLGNPVYPMLSSMFPAKDYFWQEMAKEYVAGFSGTHHPLNFLISIKNLILFNQIPGLYWPLGIFGIWFVLNKKKRKDIFIVRLGIVTFFIMWWILQPVYYIRFSIYVLPWFVIFSLLLVQEVSKKWIQKILMILLSGIFLAGLVFFGLYSKDFIRFHWDHDYHQFHRATWYYDDWQWINEHLPFDSRILTIELEQTYYLDREHFRAGPPLAKSIDWKRVKNDSEFRKLLDEMQITHIYFDYGTYKSNPIYTKMNQLIFNLLENEYADLIYKGRPRLYHSRMKNEYRETETWILSLKQNEGDL